MKKEYKAPRLQILSVKASNLLSGSPYGYQGPLSAPGFADDDIFLEEDVVIRWKHKSGVSVLSKRHFYLTLWAGDMIEEKIFCMYAEN